MTIIISQQDAASPRIGYENLFESASSVIASSEAAGFPKENAYDWRLYDWWKPATTGTHYLTAEFSTAVIADYLAIFGHDLHKWGASAQLQYGLPAQNLLTYSEQFDNAAWTKTGLLAFGSGSVADAVVSPDGTLTGDLITENISLSAHIVEKSFTSQVATYTASCYFKASSRSIAVVRIYDGSVPAGYATYFNLSTGTIGTSAGGNTAAITNAGNGWFRCSVSRILGSSATSLAQFGCSATDGVLSYTGDGVSGLYIWGAQLEQAAQSGPYIKTEATPITSGTAWLDAITQQAPSTGKVIFTGFDAVSANKWRVKLVTPTGPASLGMVAFGQALVFPKNVQPSGFRPPNLARKNEYMNNKGDTGAFLGRSLIRRSSETEIQFNLMDPDWVRETWDVFIQHAERKPFFFSWDYALHQDEAAFCWIETDIPSPEYVSPKGYMRVSLPMICLTEL